jgi:two-component system OmpR family response regulator
MARITALSRRPHNVEDIPRLQVCDLELDLRTRIAHRRGEEIPLQSKEFAMLELLMRNEGRIVTKTMILEHVWGFSFNPKTTVVETHISRLRTKIDKPFDATLIHTSRNAGYSIHAPR